MSKTVFAITVMGLLSTSAWAQQSIGKVSQVNGIVTVSDGATVGTATQGRAIGDGARFVTSSTGTAQLTLDNGCVIQLEPNQALTVDGRRPCPILIGAIENLGRTAGVVAVGGGTGTGLGGPVVALGAVAGLLLATSGGSSGSPATGGGGVTPTPPDGGGGVIPTPPISGQ